MLSYRTCCRGCVILSPSVIFGVLSHHTCYTVLYYHTGDMVVYLTTRVIHTVLSYHSCYTVLFYHPVCHSVRCFITQCVIRWLFYHPVCHSVCCFTTQCVIRWVVLSPSVLFGGLSYHTCYTIYQMHCFWDSSLSEWPNPIPGIITWKYNLGCFAVYSLRSVYIKVNDECRPGCSTDPELQYWSFCGEYIVCIY